MRIRQRILLCAVGITVMLCASCSTVGNYLPVSPNDEVIGTIQTSFPARDTWLAKKETINTQAYIKLLEAALQKYSGDIDIRDILWVTGRKINPRETEISATAKVIRVGSDDTEN